ncbi:hypothetical protein CERSUDRAFT_80223 [Gelatoporia subvermispora B]|uniref:Peroxisomal biogenesis factor 11 n=1 Tax=Ceriporiopsis subvermispora (strain B) TaxID=914234 RepID=M2R802_CERS8|nr:hypothetical protein CERSUDRAFT_80223 [Gelatoporia subvermispora B]
MSSQNGENHFSSGFDTSADTVFHMNPLSSHPPRTPRTSIVSSSHTYTTEVYSEKEETAEARTAQEDESEDEEADAHMRATQKVRNEDIFRELLKTSDGRDKTFKLLQYSLRLYLLFHAVVAPLRSRARNPWELELIKRLESTVAGLSLTRKCLILFNWLTPLTSIQAQNSEDVYVPSGTLKKSSRHKPKPKPLLHTFLHAPPPVLLDFVNGISDDIYTFSRLGLIGKRTGARAARFADWCWFASTLVNLVENGVQRSVILGQQHQVESRLYDESMAGTTTKSNPAASKLDGKELARLQRQDYWIQITRWKLLMDLIFVSYDVFHMKRAKSQVQTFTGLAAAALSTAKLYDRHKATLVKAVTSS